MTVSTPAPNLPGTGITLPTVVAGDLPGLALIGQWLEAAAGAEQLARRLVSSFFVPDAYKPRVSPNANAEEWARATDVAVANATGAILLGQSLNLDPLTALQNIYVVHGRPGMYTKLKVALAQAHGHRVWDEDYGPEKCTVAGQRKGTDDVVRITLTIDDAKRAKWTDSAMYAKTPADMLWARCAARVVDRIAADVLFGIPSIEDLDEPEPAPVAATVTVEELVARTGSSTTAAPVNIQLGQTAEQIVERLDRLAGKGTAVAAPVVEEPAVVEPVVDPAPTAAPLDESAWRRVNDAFVRLGVTGPGQKGKRLAIVCHIIGRTVVSATELSAVEGDLLLETLNGLTRPGVTALLSDLLVDRGPAGGDQGPAAPEAAPAAATGPQAAEGWPADVDPSDADLEPTVEELERYAALEAEQLEAQRTGGEA